jgi:hypothetical protein
MLIYAIKHWLIRSIDYYPVLVISKRKGDRKLLKKEGARKEKPRILHLMFLEGRVARGL